LHPLDTLRVNVFEERGVAQGVGGETQFRRTRFPREGPKSSAVKVIVVEGAWSSFVVGQYGIRPLGCDWSPAGLEITPDVYDGAGRAPQPLTLPLAKALR
jgi:hypothetical protein